MTNKDIEKMNNENIEKITKNHKDIPLKLMKPEDVFDEIIEGFKKNGDGLYSLDEIIKWLERNKQFYIIK